MQRPNSSRSSRSDNQHEDHVAIDMSEHCAALQRAKQAVSSPTRFDSPNNSTTSNKRWKSWRKKHWIYSIPLLLLLLISFFLICFFFNSVELEIKDLTAIHQSDVLEFVNEMHFAHTSLAKATP